MAMKLHRLAAIVTVLLAACATEPKWDKPGATPASIAADLQSCRDSAPYVPRQHVPAPSSKPASSLIDFKTLSEREGDRFLKDERYVSKCMRDKDYSDTR